MFGAPKFQLPDLKRRRYGRPGEQGAVLEFKCGRPSCVVKVAAQTEPARIDIQDCGVFSLFVKRSSRLPVQLLGAGHLRRDGCRVGIPKVVAVGQSHSGHVGQRCRRPKVVGELSHQRAVAQGGQTAQPPDYNRQRTRAAKLKDLLREVVVPVPRQLPGRRGEYKCRRTVRAEDDCLRREVASRNRHGRTGEGEDGWKKIVSHSPFGRQPQSSFEAASDRGRTGNNSGNLRTAPVTGPARRAPSGPG